MLQHTDTIELTEQKHPRQKTLSQGVLIDGRGLFHGDSTSVKIEPAAPDTGIVFERMDLDPPVQIPALVENVIRESRRTTLQNEGVKVEMVEHCLSALAGLRVDNALVRVSSSELPGGDGSALPYVEPILQTGFMEQDVPRQIFRLKESIVLEDGDAMIAAIPHDGDGMRIVYDLDYGSNAYRIKKQTYCFHFGNDDYVKDIAPARTYSLREEAEALWAQGLCTHLSPENVLVIGEEGPIDNEYRFDDELVRHKVLDLIGDLSLVGCQISCRILAFRSGHSLNLKLGRQIRQQMRQADLARSTSQGRVMDAMAIQKIMPHRYPMLLVDRVVEIQGDERAVGVKNVTINEPFFQGHYPGTPIMPGVLIVEAMAQMGGLLLSRKLEHTGKIAVLLSLDKVKLRKPVIPGDQLVLIAESVRAKVRTGNVSCKALVGDKVAAEAQIRFMMVDADKD